MPSFVLSPNTEDKQGIVSVLQAHSKHCAYLSIQNQGYRD